MAFLDQYNLTQETDFRNKIRIAMVRTALMVQGEAQTSLTSGQWTARANFANKVIITPDTVLDFVVTGVAADETITSGSLDTDLESRLTEIWDDLSGVTGEILALP